MDKYVYAGNEKVGKVKELKINPENWKVIHLELELTKDAAEYVLGARKGGVKGFVDRVDGDIRRARLSRSLTVI